MKALKVSIVTPCFNSSRTLESTILSVLNQTYSNIEYIVIDGGSNDGTREILKKYRKAGKLHYVSEPDDGMYDAINKGLKMTTGDLFGYLNSDDCYFPWTVEKAVEAFLEDRRIQMVYGDSMVVEAGNKFPRLNFYPEFSWHWLRCGAIICQPTVFLKRDLVAKTGGFSMDVKWIADCEYWLRAISKEVRVKKLNEFLAIEHNHGETLRKKHRREIEKEMGVLLKKYQSSISGPPFLRWLWLRVKYYEKEIKTIHFIYNVLTGKQSTNWSEFSSAYDVRCSLKSYLGNKLLRAFRSNKEPIWRIQRRKNYGTDETKMSIRNHMS